MFESQTEKTDLKTLALLGLATLLVTVALVALFLGMLVVGFHPLAGLGFLLLAGAFGGGFYLLKLHTDRIIQVFDQGTGPFTVKIPPEDKKD